MDWQPISTAPRDGTQILIAWDNSVFWEYDVVWWSGIAHGYPWAAVGTDYPENRPELWQPIKPPFGETDAPAASE